MNRILVANRGEIAVRVIRACRELGVETVAVYSTADRDSLPTRLADRAVCVGPPPAARSYLDQTALLTAALHTDCDAVHPGVGFLSENAAFARLVEDQGLVFIGPRPATIGLLGDKVEARAAAAAAGLPVTPGTTGAVDSLDAARAALRDIGYPAIIKAAAGGGGKGIRVVRSDKDLADNFSIAGREAAANFSDSRVFIERYVENPRHVELQILAADGGGADGGTAVAILGERDCSVQRNHQKLVEESPSTAVTPAMRERMARGAAALFGQLGYRGAGTIEFLVTGDAAADQQFYFMEVNARVQVEHPVTEMVTGVDVVREQIRACLEGRLGIPAGTRPVTGWAVECRINALGPGVVTRLDVPGGPGTRFDSYLSAGCRVPPQYDVLVGKVIVHDDTRDHALNRMDRALAELVIDGVPTNRDEQRAIVNDPVFRSGVFGTSFYDTVFAPRR